MDSHTVSQSSGESLVPSSQPLTPITSHAALPDKEMSSKIAAPDSSSRTPPPSTHAAQLSRAGSRTPTPGTSQLSSPPATAKKLKIDAAIIDDQYLRTASPDDLRDMLTDALSAVHEAKTTAAHYKLQHQMAQMESGEAVERMAVEMDMARRELEVLQQAQLRRAPAVPKQAEVDPTFTSIHVDVYHAMVQDIQDLKLRNSHLEMELGRSKQLLQHQDTEIASLNDRVLLMRERIRESRDHLSKSRRTASGAVDSTPRTDRSTPYRTPGRDRNAPHSSPNQPGFAALLQATDLISQGDASPTQRDRNGHTGQSMSSFPATPQRGHGRFIASSYYTPQHRRQAPLQAPQTAPMPRKRNFEATTPTPKRYHEVDSDGTVSAEEDSEAETEVADGNDHVAESRAGQLATDILGSPTAGRGKSTTVGKDMMQSTLFGHVRKAGVQREADGRDPKRNRLEDGRAVFDTGIKES